MPLSFYSYSSSLPKPVISKKKKNKINETVESVKTHQAQSSAEPQTSEEQAEGLASVSRFGNENLLRDRYRQELRLFIEANKYYPAIAQKRGEEGQVHVSFIIQKDGAITDVRLLKLCPFHRLNEATLQFFRKFNVFKKIPDELGENKLEVSYLIDYRLL